MLSEKSRVTVGCLGERRTLVRTFPTRSPGSTPTSVRRRDVGRLRFLEGEEGGEESGEDREAMSEAPSLEVVKKDIFWRNRGRAISWEPSLKVASKAGHAARMATGPLQIYNLKQKTIAHSALRWIIFIPLHRLPAWFAIQKCRPTTVVIFEEPF